jgi:hypothetical protein
MINGVEGVIMVMTRLSPILGHVCLGKCGQNVDENIGGIKYFVDLLTIQLLGLLI